MKLTMTSAEAVQVRQAMIEAASIAMEHRDNCEDMASVLRSADEDEFDVIIRQTLDEDTASDPVMTGLCKYLRYADENGGLSPGDCLDVQITLRMIAPWVPRKMKKLFKQLEDLMKDSISSRSPVEFCGKR